MNHENKFKRKDKTMHIAEWFYTEKLVNPLLPKLSQTNITPNMITIVNVFFTIVLFYLGYNEKNLLCGLGVQIYLFLDILDGNLARYKNMTSEFGKKIDWFCDLIFYSLIFIFIGLKTNKPILWIIPSVLTYLYGFLATNYIGPNLKKLKVIKRSGMKKYFMDKGLIIGMDMGTVDIIITICLIINKKNWLLFIITFGYVLDIFYRIKELKYNQKLNSNMEV